MKLYDYDYSDMISNISFNCDWRKSTTMISKVYPTKLEIKVDEETNCPYMYYEGIVQTNKGAMKVTFLKLDLVLDCASIETLSVNEWDYYPETNNFSHPDTYRVTTEFRNNMDGKVIYQLELLNKEDCKDIKEYFDKRYNI